MPHPLRERLPRTYQAFLGRFDRPTAIQELAVPDILDGHDVLLCAPTASGKTEAYAAPLVEACFAHGRPEPASLLFVSPTRALANDLHRRLQARMDELGLGFGRWTSEHKERAGGELPAALLLTPEGLDSLLARRPDALAAVRALVLDEIHVLDNTPRGDQLRVLLHRLDRVTRERPQRLAASATVEDARALGGRYLVDPVVHAVGGARRLRRRHFRGTGPEAFRKHLNVLAEAGLRKVLVFANSRRVVEELSAALRGKTRFGEQVFPHHGSLSRSVRERTERRFLEAPSAVAVATLTLELGIDIGDVDYVLLCEPPPSVSSLLQRVGRGGRRGETTRLGFAGRHAADELVLDTMLRSGARGELHERPYSFRAGVLVQQALCLLGARGSLSPSELAAELPPELAPTPAAPFANELLGRMVQRELCEPPRGGRYVLEEALERRYERGQLHANFADPANMELVDRLTGEVLGRVAAHRMKDQLGFAGGGRKAVAVRGDRVLTDAGGEGEAARFDGSTAPLVAYGLGRAVARELGAGEDEILIAHLGERWCLLHGLGTLGGLLLAESLGRTTRALAVSGASGYVLGLDQRLEEWAPFEPQQVGLFLQRHSARLTRLCGLGAYHDVLPERVREQVLRAACGLDALVEATAGFRLREIELEPAQRELWRDL